MSEQPNIGVIGMGVMGSNLALNIASKEYYVAIYNRSKSRTDKIIANNCNKNILPSYSIEDFVLSLVKPRIIFIMITSGIYVDNVIKELSAYISPGDVLIDGGNSFYKDTMRRSLALLKKGIDFMGLGISGGESGALYGPSLMPGGEFHAYKKVQKVLTNIAACIDNEPCVTYLGPNGAGHYVKMVHNGIEYGEMQIISEIYFLLKNVFHVTYDNLGEIFHHWNQGELNSYLLEITSRIFLKKDMDNCNIVDYVLDIADSKGTGSWMVQDACNLQVASNIIAESVFSRYVSMLKEQRLTASNILSGPEKQKISPELRLLYIEKARKALYLGKIILYAQAFHQLAIASNKYNWNLNFKKIAKIFRAGCIIRSKFLQRIIDIYSQNPDINNLMLAPYCTTIINNYQNMLREIVIFGIKNGIAMPALSAVISYYDSYRSKVLPANLIQAQRDCFGAHTYARSDRPGVFHTCWLK
ncbi:NADP-dependent phosphogluconate dehydrogenase [Candidatus Blochmannia ocreatus (nom. nud.)]|uniref:6-phosphogluconate dehydrogenase, decarboxylating n=1 Tax=Candidatus Blochmannia ocreatus (nom. nud.) TaxID=251538 RepID=A0ABY4SXH1_9ENTR|nr:NADP-dependent phosphogluconate dehydrogenase [Candidatus Blochmannia ocreatus]URJ24963.1 NADP-dependent phosphogluconate dehydrogenase [Candidatus Blochmannia ocreatus]